MSPLRHVRVLACCAPMVAALCVHSFWSDDSSQERADPHPVRSALLNAEAGDLVFRRGRSLNGRAVLMADGASRFSHVGLVIEGRSGPRVAHAVPPADGAPGGLVTDSIEDFLSPEVTEEWAFYRLKESFDRETRLRAAAEAASMVAGRPAFDDRFDLTDDGEIYCTELVWRAYLKAGLDLVDGHYDQLRWPLRGNLAVILPSRLEKSPYVQKFVQQQKKKE